MSVGVVQVTKTEREGVFDISDTVEDWGDGAYLAPAQVVAGRVSRCVRPRPVVLPRAGCSRVVLGGGYAYQKSAYWLVENVQ